MKYLIDASNLHIGGGVQVGASLVNELALLATEGEFADQLALLQCVVSTEIAGNLTCQASESPLHIRVSDSRPSRWAEYPQSRYRAVLTLFGPHYRRRRASREVVGFALPRMIYKTEEVGLPTATFQERLLNEMRWRRFSRVDAIVVETEDAASRVMRQLVGKEVHVVHNCVNRAVSDASQWISPIDLAKIDDDIQLVACIARDYPHKNLAVLAPLGREIERQTSRRVRFAVTLTDYEWASKPEEFRRTCVNFGVLKQRELGPVYSRCAAMLFTSLMEVSSATPLEGMHLQIPVFAFDVPVLRAVYGESLRYLPRADLAACAREIVTTMGEVAVPSTANVSRGAPDDGPRRRAIEYLQTLNHSSGR